MRPTSSCSPGGGAIFRHKREARRSFLCDIDPVVATAWQSYIGERIGMTVLQGSAMYFLHSAVSLGPGAPRGSLYAALQDPHTFLYLDPPYLGEVRTREFYTHEMTSVDEHGAMLELARQLPCMVAISGYSHPLYHSMLAGWRAISYNAMTRGGLREEWLWMNYPAPTRLHDVRYAGKDYRERERIGRRKTRWLRKLRAMGPLERQVLLEALAEVGEEPDRDDEGFAA